MINPQYWQAPTTGCEAGTLDTTGVQCNSAAVLTEGYWEVEADVEYYVATSRSAAPALAALTTGCTRHIAYRVRRFYSAGDLYITIKAVSATGTYTLNKYE